MAAQLRVKYTKEERILLVTLYLRHQADYQTIFNEFAGQHPHRRVPTRQMVYKLNKKFQETGSVEDAPRTGRPATVVTEDNMHLVAAAFVEAPNQSARRTSLQLDISDRSLRRMLSKMKYHCYRPRLIHAITEDDPDRRLEFCEWFTGCAEDNAQFYQQILYSDEAQFKLNGRINRHNSVYWASDNPHATIQQELNLPGITVWAGIHAGGLIGPYFFEGTVNAENYLELLIDLKGELENNPELAGIRYFQQDGAPPHYGLHVREYLNAEFGMWIGRRGRIEWPARSPDLTPCDFALWGVLKNKVFATPLRDIDHLKTRIEEEFDALRAHPDFFQKTCSNVIKRCHICIEEGGMQFEHKM
jgi:transposase